MTRYTICTYINHETYFTAWMGVEWETERFYVEYGVKGEKSFLRRHCSTFASAKLILNQLVKAHDMEEITFDD